MLICRKNVRQIKNITRYSQLSCPTISFHLTRYRRPSIWSSQSSGTQTAMKAVIKIDERTITKYSNAPLLSQWLQLVNPVWCGIVRLESQNMNFGGILQDGSIDANARLVMFRSRICLKNIGGYRQLFALDSSNNDVISRRNKRGDSRSLSKKLTRPMNSPWFCWWTCEVPAASMKIFLTIISSEMTAMWCEQSADQIIQLEWDRGLTILQPVLVKVK